MNEVGNNGFFTKEVDRILGKLDKLDTEINNVKVDVAKLNTRFDLLVERFESFDKAVEEHERNCPVKKDYESFRKEYTKATAKVIISWIFIAAAVVGIGNLIQMLLK